MQSRLCCLLAALAPEPRGAPAPITARRTVTWAIDMLPSALSSFAPPLHASCSAAAALPAPGTPKPSALTLASDTTAIVVCGDCRAKAQALPIACCRPGAPPSLKLLPPLLLAPLPSLLLLLPGSCHAIRGDRPPPVATAMPPAPGPLPPAPPAPVTAFLVSAGFPAWPCGGAPSSRAPAGSWAGGGGSLMNCRYSTASARFTRKYEPKMTNGMK